MRGCEKDLTLCLSGMTLKDEKVSSCLWKLLWTCWASTLGDEWRVQRVGTLRDVLRHFGVQIWSACFGQNFHGFEMSIDHLWANFLEKHLVQSVVCLVLSVCVFQLSPLDIDLNLFLHGLSISVCSLVRSAFFTPNSFHLFGHYPQWSFTSFPGTRHEAGSRETDAFLRWVNNLTNIFQMGWSHQLVKDTIPQANSKSAETHNERSLPVIYIFSGVYKGVILREGTVVLGCIYLQLVVMLWQIQVKYIHPIDATVDGSEIPNQPPFGWKKPS